MSCAAWSAEQVGWGTVRHNRIRQEACPKGTGVHKTSPRPRAGVFLARGGVSDDADQGRWHDQATHHVLMQEQTMSTSKRFTNERAKEIGDALGVDWRSFDVEQFRMGLDVELEHGTRDPSTDVTGNDDILTGKIALAHLNEFADYYTRLTKMEREAEDEDAGAN